LMGSVIREFNIFLAVWWCASRAEQRKEDKIF
jgi:hypothetical protein